MNNNIRITVENINIYNKMGRYRVCIKILRKIEKQD